MSARQLFCTLWLLCTSLASPAQTYTPYIHVDQFGYLPQGEKIAVFSDPVEGFDAAEEYVPSPQIQVIDAASGEVVFTGQPSAWNGGAVDEQSGNRVWQMDFSTLTQTGTFYVYDPDQNLRSAEFEISPTVYNAILNRALKAFYYERCGTPKEAKYAGAAWQDAACHLADTACRSILAPDDATLELDLSGGWHGSDVYFRTVNDAWYPVHLLLSSYMRRPELWSDNIGIPESGNGLPDILDEVKWELDWLMKMQQPDGSVLMKVSKVGWAGESPPSADDFPRFYGPPQSSATRRFSSMMAHAAVVFAERPEPEWQAYSDTLVARAEAAWFWVAAHPGYSSYDDAGFDNSESEIEQYEQDAALTLAALYLYAATGSGLYKSFFEFRYADLDPVNWYYWYPWEGVIQDALLFYLDLPDATPSVVSAISESFVEAVEQNNEDLLQAWLEKRGAYLAYLPEYSWLGNLTALNTARLYTQALQYGMDTLLYAADYRSAAEAYLHYLHGLNPLNKTFVSNMSAYGAENSCREVFHYWFYDQTPWDNAETSDFGPPPGFVVSGPNQYYEPDESYGGTISPPQFQPPMKSYLDWNTDWPENSWYVSLVDLEMQAAYVRLLTEFAGTDALTTSVFNPEAKGESLLFSLYPNPVTSSETFVKWKQSPPPVRNWRLYSASAQLLQVLPADSPERIALPKNLPAGLYMVEAVDRAGMVLGRGYFVNP